MLNEQSLMRLTRLIHQVYPACMTLIDDTDCILPANQESMWIASDHDLFTAETETEAVSRMGSVGGGNSLIAHRLLDMLLQLERYFYMKQTVGKYSNFDLLMLLENCLAIIYPRCFKIWWHLMFMYDDHIRNFPQAEEDNTAAAAAAASIPLLLRQFRRRYEKTLHRLNKLSQGCNLVVLWHLVQWYEPPLDTRLPSTIMGIEHDSDNPLPQALLSDHSIMDETLVGRELNRDCEYRKLTHRYQRTKLALQFAMQCLHIVNRLNQRHASIELPSYSSPAQRGVSPPLNPLLVKEKCITLLMKVAQYDSNVVGGVDINLALAERLAQELVQDTHSHPRSMFLLGTIYQRKMDLESAIQCFEKAIAIEHAFQADGSAVNVSKNPLIALELKKVVFALDQHRATLRESGALPKQLLHQSAHDYWAEIVNKYQINLKRIDT